MLGLRSSKGHDEYNGMEGLEDTFTFRGLSSFYLLSTINHVTT